MTTESRPAAAAVVVRPTRVTVRVTSCDAKVMGTLVGGCRVRILHRDTGEVLAEGEQLGGSGDTEAIMETPRSRGDQIFTAAGTACFQTTLDLSAPVPVEIQAEGPMAFPEALQRATKTTWLIPGQDIVEDGLVLTLHGMIVDVQQPAGVDILHSRQQVELEVGLRLL